MRTRHEQRIVREGRYEVVRGGDPRELAADFLIDISHQQQRAIAMAITIVGTRGWRLIRYFRVVAK